MRWLVQIMIWVSTSGMQCRHIDVVSDEVMHAKTPQAELGQENSVTLPFAFVIYAVIMIMMPRYM